ncbi:O-antigen ligase family protein [Microcoleus sp. FACHB-SPT15]|uniref:O-antigen ligase family protein n=1 Tax=Microcoleus sp. FACHB-SPT15 TaxID=2692830 RepID=UPI00177AC085|nr:O-antigen ligase family protein [Microcoleus sp. FACHB-SPT15]MBD1805109.1 O-antigen ligase family protein [Microcoleus sp. FACHB-SPT15]
MKTQLIGRIWRRLEPWIAGLMILYGLEIAWSPALFKVLKPGSYGILAILIIGQWKRLMYVATRDISLWLLVGTALVSFFWSAAPDFTLDESKALLRSTLFGVYLATRYSPKEQMRLLAWTIGIVALLSLFFCIAVPSQGLAEANNEVTWRGIFTHKQYLGRFMAIGSPIFLLTAFDSKKYRWVPLTGLGLSVALILLSKSRTSLVAMLLSLLMLPLYNVLKQNYKLRTALLLLSLLLCSMIAVLIVTNWEFLLVDTLGKDVELNGRLPIWTLIINKGMEQPWLGYGYAGFWTSSESVYVLNNSWAGTEDLTGTRFHAHNGFIDLFIQLGFIGLTLFGFNLTIVFQKVMAILNTNKAGEYFWMFIFLAILLFFNITEVITILSTGTMWSLYVLVNLSAIVQLNRLRREHDLKLALNQTEGIS